MRSTFQTLTSQFHLKLLMVLCLISLFPNQAFAQNETEWANKLACELAAATAQEILLGRQNGMPVDELTNSILNDYPTASARAFLTEIVEMGEAIPRADDPEVRKEIANQYLSISKLLCADRVKSNKFSLEAESSLSSDVPSGVATAEMGEGADVVVGVPKSAMPTLSPEQAAVINALSNADDKLLISSVLKAGLTDWLSSEKRKIAEDRIFTYVRPLPVSNAQANRDAYAALLLLNPTNKTYAAKAEDYGMRVEKQRRSIVAKMKKTTDDFQGVTFYQHPAKPRYANTRSYLLPYVGVNGSRVWMRIKLHYTNDSWLFVKKARLNIDGNIVMLKTDDWQRDNGPDIWEWTDLAVNKNNRELLKLIAESKKTTIRLDGRQYYDTFELRDRDKQAIRDMFLLEEVLIEQTKG
jgi:hypothetical protein